MNEFKKTNNSIISTENNSIALPVELYELAEFKKSYHEGQSEAGMVLSKVAGVINDTVPVAKEVKLSRQEKEIKYVVDMSQDIAQAIERGEIKLSYNKSGEIFAQLLDKNNHFSDKFPIKKELIAAGINPNEVSTALQLKAIENQLNEIMGMMEDISRDVVDIIKGQENDRIALYNSGCNLYLEAKNISDPMLKKLVNAQALKSLGDGSEQLILELKSNVQYLLNKEYKAKKGKSQEDMQEKIDNINRIYEVIHKSFILKSLIYYESGEMQPMLSVLSEYGRFLKWHIVPNAIKLSEFDKNDFLLQGGKWETRAKLFDKIDQTKQQIAENQVYYLGADEKDER